LLCSSAVVWGGRNFNNNINLFQLRFLSSIATKWHRWLAAFNELLFINDHSIIKFDQFSITSCTVFKGMLEVWTWIRLASGMRSGWNLNENFFLLTEQVDCIDISFRLWLTKSHTERNLKILQQMQPHFSYLRIWFTYWKIYPKWYKY